MILSAKLIWATPDLDNMIGYMARVSNKDATPDDPSDKLIKYLIKNKHWSPFEMASVCMEIETTRDIARQILRHRSFHFQEFSQRYSEVDEEVSFCGARLQDHKNRQNSIVSTDEELNETWFDEQWRVWNVVYDAYKAALANGIAKEVARKLLPEGLTKTKMYMSGTIRDWIHYVSIRTEKGTQLEHREVANQILAVLEDTCPTVIRAARQAGVIEPAKND